MEEQAQARKDEHFKNFTKKKKKLMENHSSQANILKSELNADCLS